MRGDKVNIDQRKSHTLCCVYARCNLVRQLAYDEGNMPGFDQQDTGVTMPDNGTASMSEASRLSTPKLGRNLEVRVQRIVCYTAGHFGLVECGQPKQLASKSSPARRLRKVSSTTRDHTEVSWVCLRRCCAMMVRLPARAEAPTWYRQHVPVSA
jgi:hypothetical protein